MAAVVTRTDLSVILYVHCLSCYVVKPSKNLKLSVYYPGVFKYNNKRCV